MNALLKRLDEVSDALENEQFGYFPDMCGTRTVFIPPSQKALELMGEGQMLCDLLHLRKPVGAFIPTPTTIEFNIGVEWGTMMRHGACPCPGVPEHMWTDYMGDAE